MTAFRADRTLRTVLRRAAATVAILAAWEVAIGSLRLAHGLVPAPSAVAGRMASDGFGFYATAALPTLLGAGLGWLVGNGIGVCVAGLGAVAPRVGRPLAALALTAFCIPGVALGPILAVMCSAEVSRIALAALPIVFLTAETLALQAATVPAGTRDAVRAFGGGRLAALISLDLPAAVPGLFTALRVSVPFALLGAVSAELLGAERGLGVVLVAAQHRLMFDRAWAVALLLGSLAALASGALAKVGRWVAPWSACVPIEPTPARAGLRRPAARSAVAGLAGSTLRAAFILGAWWAAPLILGLPPTIAKGPLDVLAYLADPARGAARRGRLAADMASTMGDTLLGLACGAALAVACAVATTAVRPLRSLVIAPALVAQCLPVAAFTPLVVLAFGRGAAVAAAVGTLVVFVPVVLRLWDAFSRMPRAMTDVARVSGASRARSLLHVLMPAAVPALLASVRTAVPLACAGALLAEWLATGHGAGYGMLTSAASFDYAAVWARTAAATGFTLLLYALLSAAESRLLARWTGEDRASAGLR